MSPSSLCSLLLLGSLTLFPGLIACAEETGEAAKKSDDTKEVSLFDGETMKGWKRVEFGGGGEVYVEDGALMLSFGEVMTGVVIEGEPRYKMNYEISLDAKRVSGTDFFCALTFPINDVCSTLVVGGWGGALVGISSVDNMDASENSTGVVHKLKDETWYHIRLRVTDEVIWAWIDDQQVVKLPYQGHKMGMRAGQIEACMPLGIASFQTKAALKNIKVKPVDPNKKP